MDNENIRCSVTGSEDSWKACIRYRNKIIWACDHLHTNRDQTTMTNGQCAKDCCSMAWDYAKLSNEELETKLANERPYDNRMLPNDYRTIALHKAYLAHKKYALSVRDKIREAISEVGKASFLPRIRNIKESEVSALPY